MKNANRRALLDNAQSRSWRVQMRSASSLARVGSALAWKRRDAPAYRRAPPYDSAHRRDYSGLAICEWAGFDETRITNDAGERKAPPPHRPPPARG